VSYPFKGFEPIKWVCLGKMRGRARQLLPRRFVLRFVGRWVVCAQLVISSRDSVVTMGCKPSVGTVHLLEAWCETDAVGQLGVLNA
jgi:hypothetical protein